MQLHGGILEAEFAHANQRTAAVEQDMGGRVTASHHTWKVRVGHVWEVDHERIGVRGFLV